MNRRDFLKKGAYATAGTLAGASIFSSMLGVTGCTPAAAAAPKVVGLQLFSLREAMGQDVPGTLKKVADMGYKSLETAGYGDGKLYGYSPSEFKKMAEGLGMAVTSAHLGRGYEAEKDAEIMEWWKVALDAQAEVGCRYAIQPSFHIGDTLDSIKVYSDYFNRVADIAATKGLKFGFHNHAKEFELRDGQMIQDYLIQNANDNMMFELDVYWTSKGGVNPIDYINKFGSKIPVLHIKDESIIGDSETIDFEGIFNAAYANGMKDYYVEVERYTLPAEVCVQKSFDFLDAAQYVK